MLMVATHILTGHYNNSVTIMKNLFILVGFLFSINSIHAQQVENIIIITTDGFRWQELFKGMESAKPVMISL